MAQGCRTCSSFKFIVLLTAIGLAVASCNQGGKKESKNNGGEDPVAPSPQTGTSKPCNSPQTNGGGGTNSSANTGSQGGTTGQSSGGGVVYLNQTASPSPSASSNSNQSSVVYDPCASTSPNQATSPNPTSAPGINFEDLLKPPADCQDFVWSPTTKKSDGTPGVCHKMVKKVSDCKEASAKKLFVDKGISQSSIDAAFADKLSGGFSLYQCGKSETSGNPYVNFILKSTDKLQEKYICISGTPECNVL